MPTVSSMMAGLSAGITAGTRVQFTVDAKAMKIANGTMRERYKKGDTGTVISVGELSSTYGLVAKVKTDMDANVWSYEVAHLEPIPTTKSRHSDVRDQNKRSRMYHHNSLTRGERWLK